MTEFNMNMEKVKAQMSEHWDMDAETFDAHTVNSIFEQGDGWGEVDFKNADGDVCFFIEVDGSDEVWNYEPLVSWIH